MSGCDTTRVPEDGERHFNIHTDPETMAGHYANFANVSHSDYEFTLTFARVDHEVEEGEVPGVVVSRINLSPRFMRELIDAMEDNFSKWRTREGIRDLPEFDEPARRRLAPRDSAGRPRPRRRCSTSRGCRARPRASGSSSGNLVSSTPPSVQVG